uniref:Uncharacterized protein n=1 Tax=Anguilla anguilla TaxID=7936 RepID=A0A0E9XJ01_ANGAN
MQRLICCVHTHTQHTLCRSTLYLHTHLKIKALSEKVVCFLCMFTC